jgi:hypothetical protein
MLATLPSVTEGAPQRELTLQVAATASSVPEADLLCQRLAEAGIAAVSQRSIGGPEWGLSGSQYVYVKAQDLARAREVLQQDSEAEND